MNAHFLPANDDTLSASILAPFRADYLNRYFADPVFRAAEDAHRDRIREARAVEIDRQILANFRPENFDDEPGFVSVLRDRIAAFERSYQS